MTTFNSDVLDRLAVAVDLVNAGVDGAFASSAPTRPAWVFEAHGYLPPASAPDWDAVAVLATRVDRLLRLVASGDHDAAVAQANAWLDEQRVTPFVEGREGRWRLHFHPATASFADGWAGGVAAALAVGYASDDASRIGGCGVDDCRRLFLDRGRNRQRRFCSLRCQNRSKSADYRRRRPPSG